MPNHASSRAKLLLNSGFYPSELPPVFRTRLFDSALGQVGPSNPDSYSGSTTFYDGTTFRGNLRTFGVINPINYMLLSEMIGLEWSNLQNVFKLSKASGGRPKFATGNDPERAIQHSTLSNKRKRLEHLAASYPVILNLDINRFYGSIYTHSIPWAALGKEEAKQRFADRTLSQHWSDKLDKRVRNCNQRQTIGIAIGPDTSRILSELVLSRIDSELCATGTGLTASQLFHSIDDYQIGVFDSQEAEKAQSLFQRIVHRYEMRINDFKTSQNTGITFSPSKFQYHFDALRNKKGSSFVEHLFEIIYATSQKYKEVNVIGYALKAFRLKLAAYKTQDLVKDYLQRLTFASPHDARWTLPLLLGIYHQRGTDADTRRFIQWGIEVSVRRNDVLTLLWFLYAAIFIRMKLSKAVSQQCYQLANELVDLMLMHGKHERLISLSITEMRSRYDSADFNSPAWIVLYEVERHNWDSSAAFRKAGGTSDPEGLYAGLKQLQVEFYWSDTSAFTVEAINGWNFASDHFAPEQRIDDSWDYDAFMVSAELDDTYL